MTTNALVLSITKFHQERYAPTKSTDNLGVRLKTNYVLTDETVRLEIERLEKEKKKQSEELEENRRKRIELKEQKAAVLEIKKKAQLEKKERVAENKKNSTGKESKGITS